MDRSCRSGFHWQRFKGQSILHSEIFNLCSLLQWCFFTEINCPGWQICKYRKPKLLWAMSTGCFSSIRHLWSSQKSVSCGRFLKKTRLWVTTHIPADNFENKLEMRKTDLKVTCSYLGFPYPSPEQTCKTGKAIAFIGMQFWRVSLKTVRCRNVWGFHGSKKGRLEGRCFKICYFFLIIVLWLDW